MSRRIRAAVLSAGAWSRSSHLPTLASAGDIDIVAVTSPDEARARAVAAEFGIAQAFSRWQDALALKPDIVVVSSPPVAHEEQVVAALRSGAHVLVEKPFALESAAARRMHTAARETGRGLIVGFAWPASPAFRLARALVEDGEVGDVELGVCHLDVNTRAVLLGGDDGGWGAADRSEPTTYTDRAISGGGAAAVSMSHQLGLMNWLIGERFTTVDASTVSPVGDIDLHVAANLTLDGGGAASLSCASTHPYLTRPQWRVALYGARGQIWVDSILDTVRLVRSDGEVREYSAAEASGAYDAGAPTRALIEMADGASAPAAMCSALAVHVVEVTDAIYESAARRGRVEIGAVSGG